MRIVGVGVGREGAGGAVLEALIDRQDHHLAGAAELAVHQQAGKVRLGAGAIALVVVEDLLDGTADLHGGPPFSNGVIAGEGRGCPWAGPSSFGTAPSRMLMAGSAPLQWRS